jgi:hypothetical protein
MIPSVASEKSPATPPGIDPETFRLVAQCLNHYATPGPRIIGTLLIYVFRMRMILTMAIVSLYKIKRLVFVMGTHGALCEVETISLYGSNGD